MVREELYNFIRERKLAVVASLGPDGGPQSALVGFAVSPGLEIVFDTVKSSRKYVNLQRDPRIAIVFVLNGEAREGEITVQYEGLACEPEGDELAHAKTVYFAAWPDGREREKWPGIAYFLVKPKWIRYSDFELRQIEEFRFEG